jgi:hypothetical protein
LFFTVEETVHALRCSVLEGDADGIARAITIAAAGQ